MTGRPICRRCLLADMQGERPLYEIIAEYLQAMPEEQKATETSYQNRLSVCKDCDALANGTCRLCGCYVEVRAAKAWQSCPDVPPRWGKDTPENDDKGENT